MARTIEQIRYTNDFQTVKSQIEILLNGNGFSLTELPSGETVWKKGTGMMTAMQFLKVEYGPGTVVLSAWVSAGLGSMTMSEMALDGFVGIAAKKPLKNLIGELKKIIQ